MLEFLVGIGLSASAGLNAWIPLFALGLADKVIPAVELPAGWAWLSSDAALWIVGVLLVIELVADKIPAVDSINDVLQTVIRPAAGGIAFGAGAGSETARVTDPTGIFADGNWVPIATGVVIALAVHAAKAGVRVAANTATAGLAAPATSVAGDIISTVLAVSAIVLPILVLVVLAVAVALAILGFRRARRRRRERRAQREAAATAPQ